MEIEITKSTKVVKGSNLKRFIERHWMANKMELFSFEKNEKKVPGFWNIISEYFTHE